MYLLEWLGWQMHQESAQKRKEMEALQTPAQRRAFTSAYESDFPDEFYRVSVSEKPRARGPVYAFNENFLEMRCGCMEEKRGLITMMTIGGMGMTSFMWTKLTFGLTFMNIMKGAQVDLILLSLNLFMLLIGGPIFYFYFKYGFRFTRLEMLTSRHLLIRFNRRTRQVHLHRPKSCGGIVTLPWEATGSGSTEPKDDPLSIGMRQGLIWLPKDTGLPYPELAFIGKQGQGGSELRDEWEFIRRYMEEGPASVPSPRLSTHLPSPLQAFSAQFEGIGRFIRHSGWVMRVAMVMISPAFLIIGGAHWLSLLLCWKPRWPKVIRQAGQPGKPTPPLTTINDYPPHVRERLLANADRWQLKPGQRPEKKPRTTRKRRSTVIEASKQDL